MAEASWPPAVVAGGYQTGVLAARSLVRRGVRVSIVDVDPTLQAFTSVYGTAHRCPSPDLDPRGWVSFMQELSGSMKDKPVLIASADQFVSAIADHAAELASHFVLCSGLELQGQLAIKNLQYELAAANDMPMSLTRVVRTAEDVRTVATEAAFPCVLKPFHFREWQHLPQGHALRDEKVAIAEDAVSLLGAWTSVAAVTPECMVQEIIQGPDTAKRLYVACYGRDGRRIGSAMFSEKRCLPVGFGNATLIEPVTDPETDSICDEFLTRIGYKGVCEIQVKRDQRDGRVKLIEANPRLSGGGAPGAFGGVDFCWLHYLDLVGIQVEPVAPNGRDFRHVVLRGDLRAISENHRAGLITWRDVIRSYRPPLDFFDFDPRDWRNSLMTIGRVLRSAVGLLVRPVLERVRRGDAAAKEVGVSGDGRKRAGRQDPRQRRAENERGEEDAQKNPDARDGG